VYDAQRSNQRRLACVHQPLGVTRPYRSPRSRPASKKQDIRDLTENQHGHETRSKFQVPSSTFSL
jgi:hypothetical protein